MEIVARAGRRAPAAGIDTAMMAMLLPLFLQSLSNTGASNETCCVYWPLGPGNQTKAGCEAGGDARHDGGSYYWNTGRGTPSAVCGKQLSCDCCRIGPPNKTVCQGNGKPPTPSPNPPAPGVTVFHGGEAPGYGWYFFPRLLQTPSGELLVFSEAHKVCGHASDRGWIDIVLKRSTNNGESWGAVEVVHSEAAQSPGTWIGNPAPLIDAETSMLWLVMSRNNTDVLAMSSPDWGKTWDKPTVISSQVLAPEWRSKPSWQGGWGWVATTGGMQLTSGAKKGRLVVTGDVQTPPTANCSSPYSERQQLEGRQLRSKTGDGKACSQSFIAFSDTHGKTWDYSRTLLLPGDEVSNPVQLANGSVVVDMRGHDLRSYDKGNPNNAMRWLGRSDTSATTWPSDFSHMRPFINATSVPPGQPMRFGGDCFGDMTLLQPATQREWATKTFVAGSKEPRLALNTELLVMGGIHRDGSSGGVSGRSDYRVHVSSDGGNSFSLVSKVYTGSTSYSGIRALNSTHVGVVMNVGGEHSSSMACNALTKFVVLCVRC